MKNTDKFILDEQLNIIAIEKINIPIGLSSATANKIVADNKSPKNMLPYILALVFLINIAVSVIFGGALFLMRPLSIIEWVAIGSVYSAVNVFLYGVTFINYEKIQNMLDAYSHGGV